MIALILWWVAPFVAGTIMHTYEKYYKPKGLAVGYQRLAVMNPHFVGMRGASGGQVCAVVI